MSILMVYQICNRKGAQRGQWWVERDSFTRLYGRRRGRGEDLTRAVVHSDARKKGVFMKGKFFEGGSGGREPPKRGIELQSGVGIQRFKRGLIPKSGPGFRVKGEDFIKGRGGVLGTNKDAEVEMAGTE